MRYQNLKECLEYLEKKGQLIRVREEIDPELEMASVHLRVFAAGGPAILFEKIKGCRYQAVSNLFGDLNRSRLMFGEMLGKVQALVQLRNDPGKALRRPWNYLATGFAALNALPKRGSFSRSGFEEIAISDLPLIKHWPEDGGAFVTLPQVYTEDLDQPGPMKSNLGMYRIQLNGNEYQSDKEIGLHYQLHRGIGIHQQKSNQKNQPLKVSIFAGGPPAHTLAAVMPLPEGVSELTFAGALGGRRFRYDYVDGYCISLDADFVITGEVFPNDNKPEGPFGDHLGYYSLKHDFPLMKVHKVYAKKNAIWPFTVVGRPPQEDTAFGALIHEISGTAIPHEIPGVKEIHAVDAAGVHPLLLAVGSERYTPYLMNIRPAEILTQASRILGTGQLSLAKYLYIAADKNSSLSCHDITAYLEFVFERLDLTRDLHFITKTSIDTLDYSGDNLNEGSKIIIAATGEKIRTLQKDVPDSLAQCDLLTDCFSPLKGVVTAKMRKFSDHATARKEMDALSRHFSAQQGSLSGIVQLVIYDDFDIKTLNDYLWITYTRSNPSHDIYGFEEFNENKHWGCRGPMVIDARKKPHHAPELKQNNLVLENIERFFAKGASLEGW